jgi:anti-sigma B factor antagonist
MTMMTTRYTSNPAVAAIAISGRFDAHQVPQVQQELENVLAGGARYVILNLEDVNFVDSSALAILVRGMKRCRERNGDLLLCGLRQPVRIIFELTRMDKAFRIYDTEEAARQSVPQHVS